MERDLRFRINDLAAIAGVLLLAGLFMILFFLQNQSGQDTIRIYQDGALIQELPLREDASFVINGEYTNVIVIENGSVRVAEADCPGKDCVHTGRISRTGQSIFCLPNKLEIQIAGSSEVDIIVE